MELKKKFAVFSMVLIIVALAAGGGTYAFIKNKTDKEKKDLQAQVDTLKGDLATTENTETVAMKVDGWDDYISTDYGFTVKFPTGWKTNNPTSYSVASDDLVETINFEDPERSKQMEASYCLSNRDGGWENPTPTEESCKTILAGLTEKQEKDWNTRMDTRNLFVRVQKIGSFANVKDWLVGHYLIKGSELDDYSVGDAIKVDNLNGYSSSIGCCGNYDYSYVVRNGDYIYEFGTNNGGRTEEDINYTGSTFLDKVASFIKFTDPTAGWETYNTKEYGFSFKHPESFKVTSDNDAAADEPINILTSHLLIDLGRKRTNDSDNKLTGNVSLTKVSELQAGTGSASKDIKALLDIYNSKTIADKNDAIWLPPSNAAIMGNTELEYLETADGKFRGVAYFANIGQDWGFSLNNIIVLTDGEYVFQLFVIDGTSKIDNYTLDQEGANKYINYLKTLNSASVDEPIIKDYSEKLKNLALSISRK